MPIPVIAIFDIGKTNKKLFLFDEKYRIVFEKSIQLDEITDEDGYPCEDINRLTGWIRDSFHEANALSQFDIQALNFSTCGACFVHLDEDGIPATPLYNYLKPYPPDLRKKFYDTYGGEVTFSVFTASPVLGNLNSGMQIYMLKYDKPEFFKNINVSLHFPQYVSYLFSGETCSDITSIGCHTNMWNFPSNKYHRWIDAEGIMSKLAPIRPPDSVFKSVWNEKSILVGTGLHDSSAALIPYLQSFPEPFVLLSTGTWCISLNPFNDEQLTAEELEKDCLCYISYTGKPVKASRLFSGHEHEVQTKRLAHHFNKAADYYKNVDCPPGLPHRWKSEMGNKSITLSEPFENLDLAQFQTYEDAYIALIWKLMEKQVVSTKLVLANTSVSRIFVDGGFSKNPIYMHLLAAAFPKTEVYAASMAQASALGAALAIHPHWNKHSMPADVIDLKYYAGTRKVAL